MKARLHNSGHLPYIKAATQKPVHFLRGAARIGNRQAMMDHQQLCPWTHRKHDLHAVQQARVLLLQHSPPRRRRVERLVTVHQHALLRIENLIEIALADDDPAREVRRQSWQ